MTIDSTTTKTHLGVASVLALIPEPVFVSALEIGTESKDGDFYMNQYYHAAKELGFRKIVATINDNEAAVINGQKGLKQKDEMKHVINLRCFAHVIGLFVKKLINNCPTINRMVETVRHGATTCRHSTKMNGHFKAVSLQLGDHIQLILPGNSKVSNGT